MTTTSVAPEAVTRVLTAIDRCDRCSAQARIAFEHPLLELELMFCGHHSTANNNEDVLREKGFVVTVDDRLTS